MGIGGGDLADIQENNEGEKEEGGLQALEMPNKPSYFSMFDDEEIDSEDEMVAGENNYIEIDCLPLNGVPKPVVVEAPVVAAPEEEKKEVPAACDRSSQYKGSQDGDKEEKKDNGIIVPADPAKAEEEKKAVVVPPVAAAPVINDNADDDDVFCRFCWDSANVIENPLLSVCKCSGGVGFVHYTCLKYWLKTKQSENRTFTSWTIYWRTFGCEICQ